LPAGADTVVRQEDTAPAEPGSISVGDGPGTLGKNIRYRGEDIRKGELVLDAGDPPRAPPSSASSRRSRTRLPLVHDAPARRLHGVGRRRSWT